jgi:hypothetical protein
VPPLALQWQHGHSALAGLPAFRGGTDDRGINADGLARVCCGAASSPRSASRAAPSSPRTWLSSAGHSLREQTDGLAVYGRWRKRLAVSPPPHLSPAQVRGPPTPSPAPARPPTP